MGRFWPQLPWRARSKLHATADLEGLAALSKQVERSKALKEARARDQRRMELARMLFQTSWKHNALMRGWWWLTTFIVLAAAFGWLMQLLATEIRISNNVDEASIDSAKTLGSCSAVLLILLLYKDFDLQLQLLKLHGNADKAATLYTVGWMPKLLFECAVCAIHLPPGVAYTFKVSVDSSGEEADYTLDAMFSVLMCVRMFLLRRFVRVIMGFTSSEARTICVQHAEELNFSLTFSMLSTDRPWRMLLLIFLCVLFVLSYALRMAESVVNTAIQLTENAVWMTVVTMTTVGFGDITTETDNGRMVSFSSCLCGVGAIAFFTTAVNNFTDLDRATHQTAIGLRHLSLRSPHRDAAVLVIQQSVRLFLANCRQPTHTHMHELRLQRRALLNWRSKRDQMIVTQEFSTSLVAEQVAIADHAQKVGAHVDKATARMRELQAAVAAFVERYEAPVREHQYYPVPPLDEEKKQDVLRKLRKMNLR